MNAMEEILRLNAYTAPAMQWELYGYTPNQGVKDGMAGAMIVLDAGKLFGILPESDSYREVFLRGNSLKETWLRKNMTQVIKNASPEQVVKQCLALTREKGMQHLPVIAEGRLIGIISLEDLANAVLRETAL